MNHLLKLVFVVLACSVAKALGGEIINGELVKDKSMSYMASVQSNGEHICGGFLIREDKVLTAAHCFDEERSNVSVVLGTNNLISVDNEMRYYVRTFQKHSDYKNATSGNDIMMLTLTRPSKIKPVELPNENEPEINPHTKCVVAGWGALKTGGDVVNELGKVDVSTMERGPCEQLWNGLQALPANIICAGGYLTNKGACQGDSGGPLVCNNMAVGIVSFNYNRNCDYPNLPNIYTEISKFVPWINDQ